MSPEVTVLALAGMLHGVQFALMSIPANLELGPSVTLRPRDGKDLIDLVSPRAARLVHAWENNAAALALFTVAVVVVELSGANSALTATCAWLYLAARIVYIPAYWYAWVPWRTIIWATAFTATQVMLLLALLHGLAQ